MPARASVRTLNCALHAGRPFTTFTQLCCGWSLFVFTVLHNNHTQPHVSHTTHLVTRFLHTATGPAFHLSMLNAKIEC